jgi:hypothetical protein
MDEGLSYGPHTAEALEVVDLVESGRILRDPHPPEDPDIKVIHDLEEGEAQEEFNNNADDVGWIWRDILNDGGNCGSSLVCERFERPGNEVNENLRLLSNEIFKWLDYRLSHEFEEDVIAVLLNLLDIVIAYRVSHGRSIPFVERVIEMLSLGGFPCSWEGRYPEGRMVVYFPLPE